MKKLALLMFISLFFMGCNEIKGVVTLVAPTVFDFDDEGEVEMPPGQYKVEIEIHKRSIEIDFNGRGHEVRFKIKKGTKIPKKNGSFEILAKESGQNLDIFGEVTTTVEKGELVRGYERCQRRDSRTICSGNGRGGTNCHRRDYYHDGERDVTYYPIITTKAIDVLITAADNESVEQGNLFAGEVDEERDYVHYGFCRVF